MHSSNDRIHPTGARGFLLLAVLLALGPTLGAATITGRVFDDRNGDAVQNPGEPGLPGVKVSNGVDLATTDAQGRYSLNTDEDCTVFVVKPRGFRTALSPEGLPLFYRHLVPQGTQDAKYHFKGIAPTGVAPTSMDFPLYRQDESESFRVVLTADPQPYDTKELEWYAKDTVAELASVHPAFAIALGDLVGNNLGLHRPYVEANAVTGFPWYNVIGNHDLNFDAPDDKDSDCSYRRVFGPSNYAFQYGATHFIILKNAYWMGRSTKENGVINRDNYKGSLCPEQLRFVESYVASVPSSELIVVCTHIPMVYREEGKNPMLTPEFPALLKILSGHPHTLSLSGHMHFTYSEYFGSETGYAAEGNAKHLHLSAPAASGSWFTGPLDPDGIPVTLQRDGTPHGYLWLEVNGNGYSVRYKGVRHSADEQMRIYAPATIADASKPGLLKVNFFLGNAASTVRFRLDRSKKWTEMTRSSGLDPAYVELCERNNPLFKQGKFRKLPTPVPTDHLWESQLPTSLSAGVHLVEVQAHDSYGHSFSSNTTIRVLQPNDPWLSVDQDSTRK